MSEIWCHDCRKNIAVGKPRVIYTVDGYDANGPYSTQVYVCGDCEYRRHMKKETT